jgi:hypothetical protein
MQLKCNACGNTGKFIGRQSCRGTVAVEVDGSGNFVDNPGGVFESTGLDFDDPEGPWACGVCHSEDVIQEDEDVIEQDGN